MRFATDKLRGLALLVAVLLFAGCSTDLVTPVEESEMHPVTKPGKAQGKNLVSILHKGKLILVAPSAVPAHLLHGDRLSFNGTAELPGNATMEFVSVEPGTFIMGSPDTEFGRFEDEGPQHQVTITQGFYLGQFEVTQGQWEAVMGTTPWSGQNYVQESPNNPAVFVSWEDTQDFIDVLNLDAGSELYRLATEAEWEYACSAGTTSQWSFGDDESELGEYAWYRLNAWDIGQQYPHQVGTKEANPWGLHDMHGNAFEHVQDWAGTYPSSPQEDPQGPSTGSSRVARGGNVNSDYWNVRSAKRNFNSPATREHLLGFRILRRAE